MGMTDRRGVLRFAAAAAVASTLPGEQLCRCMAEKKRSSARSCRLLREAQSTSSAALYSIHYRARSAKPS